MKIEKNIPLPKHPFCKMVIGDSIYFAVLGEEAMKTALSYGRLTGKQFVCREEKDGIRIWRTE